MQAAVLAIALSTKNYDRAYPGAVQDRIFLQNDRTQSRSCFWIKNFGPKVLDHNSHFEPILSFERMDSER